MSKAWASVLVLLAASLACGQTKGPTEISVPVGRLASIPLVIDGDEAEYAILGTDLDGLREYDPDPKKLKLRVIGYTPGTSFVVVTSQKGGKLQPIFVVKVVVSGVGPQPPPGPGPGPGPQPPEPQPGPVPIPGNGLQVLIVYEQAELAKIPPGQLAAMSAKPIRDYLNAKCIAGPDGKTKQWRVWDKDIDTQGESKLWQDAMARPKTRTPWIIISNGKAGYEGPLPTSVEETLKLLKIYGGE